MTSRTTVGSSRTPDETTPPRTYALVLAIEAAVILSLYWLGRIFS
jgi:hypothetical protein